MGNKEREELIKYIDEVIGKSLKEDAYPLIRISETTHTIWKNTDVLIQVYEASRVIEIKKPYSELPEDIRDIINMGEKAGYRIHV